MADGKQIHAKHRERLINRYLKEGLDGFEPHQVLELILFFSIPRKDTNPIAHELINRFGDLERVMTAKTEELCQVPGVGESTAELLHLLYELSDRYFEEKHEVGERYLTRRSIADKLEVYFKNDPEEKIAIVMIDHNLEIHAIECFPIERIGPLGSDYRVMLERVLKYPCCYAALVRKTAELDARPSYGEISAIIDFSRELYKIEVTVLDYFIVGPDGVSIVLHPEDVDRPFYHETTDESEG